MLLNQLTLEKAVAETLAGIPKDAGANLRKRHRNAINKARLRLLENSYISFEDGKLLILSDTRTERGEARIYETSSKECRLVEPGNTLCHAFWDGYPCWHKGAFAIVENYFKIADEVSPS